MPITKKNIFFHELIGLRVKVQASGTESLVGVEGVVVDETMNTLIVERDDGDRIRILKDHQEFMFTLPDGKTTVQVPGRLIVGRPWDRLRNIGKKQFK